MVLESAIAGRARKESRSPHCRLTWAGGASRAGICNARSSGQYCPDQNERGLRRRCSITKDVTTSHGKSSRSVLLNRSPLGRWIASGTLPMIRVRLRDVLTATTVVCAIAVLSACSQVPPPPPPPAVGAGPGGEPRTVSHRGRRCVGVRLLWNPDLNEDVVVRRRSHSTTVVRTNSPVAEPCRS